MLLKHLPGNTREGVGVAIAGGWLNGCFFLTPTSKPFCLPKGGWGGRRGEDWKRDLAGNTSSPHKGGDGTVKGGDGTGKRLRHDWKGLR
jgi:hypothetical protein